MNVYTVTTEYSAPQLGIRLLVGATVGKIGARVSCLMAGTEYTSKAFYDWVGTADSLKYMSFVGVFPDPVGPGGSVVVGGLFPITSGASVVTVAAAFGFAPSSVVATVLKPTGGSNLFPTIRVSTVGAGGFTADLQAPAPGGGYVLAYAAVQ